MAAWQPLPSFRDVTLGGNAVASAGPGYDLVTGLGTPDADNLVRNLLIAQAGVRNDQRARAADSVPTTECRVCQVEVPAGEFCGLCGAVSNRAPVTARTGCGVRDFGAAPGEHLLQPSLASSLFPHLPPPVPHTRSGSPCSRCWLALVTFVTAAHARRA